MYPYFPEIRRCNQYGMDFATVEQAIEMSNYGRMVVVVDDGDRENEGDLIIAASDGQA